MQITYGYYADEYGGKTIPEQDFRKAERQAEAYIRHLTYVKGDIFAVENDVVKDAVCAAAEVYYKYNAQQQSGTPLVKSENNDGYSVTYVTEQTDGKTDEEIVATREKAIKALKEKGYEIVNTLFTDEWYSNEAMKERGVVQIPLCFLAKSLENMSLCHAAYFCKGWENARGCRIEHEAAVAYGLDVIYEE